MSFALVRLAFLAAALLPAGGAIAADPVWAEHGDWGLQCDNTRRCSAVGYQAEGDEPQRGLAAIRISRDAGPGAPVRIDIQAIAPGDSEARWRGPLRLQAGSFTTDAVHGMPAQMPLEKALRLVQAIVESGALALQGGPHRWPISLVGMREALGRMDEIQQRQGTVGALVLRGARPETGVPGPDPVPVIRAARPVRAVKADARLSRQIFAELKPDDFDVCKPDIESSRQIHVRRLKAQALLVSATCHNGVYDGDRHWTANVHAPHRPVLLDGVEGDFDPRRGTITEYHKLVGRGSCYLFKQWQFTADGFVLAAERADRMCRGFPDGAWELPVHASRVLPPAGSTPSSNRN